MGVDIGVDIEFIGFLSIMFIFLAMSVAVRSFGPDSLAFLINEGCLKKDDKKANRGMTYAFKRASSCCCFIALSFS